MEVQLKLDKGFFKTGKLSQLSKAISLSPSNRSSS
jgi:hypothetical protein